MTPTGRRPLPARPLPALLVSLLVVLLAGSALGSAACGGPDAGDPVADDPDAGDPVTPPERAAIGEMALATTFLPRGGRVRAAVEVIVGPGLHVNANPPTFEYLIPVSVSLEGTDAIRVSRTWYPEAEHRSFPYSEEPYAVYEGSVVVGLELQADDDAPAGPTPLTVVLDYQACNDEACFPPARARAPLSVEIGPADARPEPRPSPLLARAPFAAGGD